VAKELMQQRERYEQQQDELGWWVVSDGKLVWWLAGGTWYPPESAPGYAPPAPLANPGGSGFGIAAVAIGIVVTLAGLIPLLLFISWALAPV
jgi:hypothetical protein